MQHLKVSSFAAISLQFVNIGAFLSSVSPRSRKAIRGEGPGPLRGGDLALSNNLHGLHHEDAAAAAGGGLRHHQAAPGRHLSQFQLHGPAAAV